MYNIRVRWCFKSVILERSIRLVGGKKRTEMEMNDVSVVFNNFMDMAA